MSEERTSETETSAMHRTLICSKLWDWNIFFSFFFFPWNNFVSRLNSVCRCKTLNSSDEIKTVSRAWTFNFLILSETSVQMKWVHMCIRLKSLDPRNENFKYLFDGRKNIAWRESSPLQHVDDCANDLSVLKKRKRQKSFFLWTESVIFLLLRSRNKIWTNFAYECWDLWEEKLFRRKRMLKFKRFDDKTVFVTKSFATSTEVRRTVTQVECTELYFPPQLKFFSAPRNTFAPQLSPLWSETKSRILNVMQKFAAFKKINNALQRLCWRETREEKIQHRQAQSVISKV